MTDSNSGITAQEAQQLGVALLPMPIQIDGQMYLEGIDLFPSGVLRPPGPGGRCVHLPALPRRYPGAVGQAVGGV
ncbi:MAG: hypothetical protein ACLTR8_03365 [Oscillospiraceae bacterium]